MSTNLARTAVRRRGEDASAKPFPGARFGSVRRARLDRARPTGARGLIRHWGQAANDSDGAQQCALRAFEHQVAGCGGKDAAMALLGASMAPSNHHTPLGMMATRMFAQLLDA